jgi:hypothetical protein
MVYAMQVTRVLSMKEYDKFCNNSLAEKNTGLDEHRLSAKNG